MRPFNQPERLLSEARILWEYLAHLLIPQIEGRGLFQDGFNISRGWLRPWQTLPAVVGLVGLFCFALGYRRRWPLLSQAILFFFVGQLIESSVIGLELYFEHRNYLSAALLFLPLASAGVQAGRHVTVKVVYFVGAAVLCLLAFLTWQRAQLWANTEKLQIYWAYANPESPRAQNQIASYLMESGRFDEADQRLNAAIERLPGSALLNLRILSQKVYSRRATEQDFLIAAQRIRHQTFDAQAVMSIRVVIDKVVEPDMPKWYLNSMFRVIDAMEENPAYNNLPLFMRLTPYLKGRLYLAKAELSQACHQYALAVKRYAEVDAALMMVAEIASAGAYDCALDTLALAEETLKTERDLSMRRPRKSYETDVVRLREIITSERSKIRAQTAKQ
jgi:tetratricopeptide (TPR) repeat protein